MALKKSTFDKKLDFGEGFVELLESGQKQITIRRGRRDFRPDDWVEGICAEGDRFILQVTGCEVTTALDISEEDLRDDGFCDLDDFFAGMRKFYPNLSEEDEITVIRFEVLTRIVW
jgi:hypothetical protein